MQKARAIEHHGQDVAATVEDGILLVWVDGFGYITSDELRELAQKMDEHQTEERK